MRKLISTILIVIGISLFVFGGYLVWERNSPKSVSFTTPPPVQKGSLVENVTELGQPKVLKIPSINKELQIYPSQIVNNHWQSTKLGVSYLSTSPIPGEVGNSILYGHNFPSLLKDLPKVKVGDEITIVYENGDERKFTVQFTQTVGPDQSSILDSSGDRRITLYTCTGFLDTKRFVVTALLNQG